MGPRHASIEGCTGKYDVSFIVGYVARYYKDETIVT
jgi:hypothetical protein